ncbi:MAG: hypothetical protein HY210_01785 [Candidatus Omnitrophica bacterium]|nr:hypothetical protein [Candidatus Omnitrophota bacterium]
MLIAKLGIIVTLRAGPNKEKLAKSQAPGSLPGDLWDNQPQRLKAAIVLASVMPPQRKSFLTADLRRGFVRIISSVSLVPVCGVSFSALKMWYWYTIYGLVEFKIFKVIDAIDRKNLV